MTNFSTQLVAGPVIGSMVSGKGDVSNRTKCAGAQLKNNAATLLQFASVTGAGAGTVALARSYKFRGVAKPFVKVFDKIISKFPKEGSMARIAEKLTHLPGWAKTAALVAIPVLAAVGYIRDKHIYKMGQIDQKYTDKAEIESKQKEYLL